MPATSSVHELPPPPKSAAITSTSTPASRMYLANFAHLLPPTPPWGGKVRHTINMRWGELCKSRLFIVRTAHARHDGRRAVAVAAVYVHDFGNGIGGRNGFAAVIIAQKPHVVTAASHDFFQLLLGGIKKRFVHVPHGIQHRFSLIGGKHRRPLPGVDFIAERLGAVDRHRQVVAVPFAIAKHPRVSWVVQVEHSAGEPPSHDNSRLMNSSSVLRGSHPSTSRALVMSAYVISASPSRLSMNS